MSKGIGMDFKLGGNDLAIITLPHSEWREYKKIRLSALKNEPHAFGASYKEEAAFPDQAWILRLTDAENDKSCVLFAKLNGKIVGMITGGRTEQDITDHTAHIWGLYVEPPARTRKIADTLTVKVLEWFSKKADIRSVLLDLNADLGPARRLYESLDFREVRRYTNTLGDGKEHEVVEMKKQIR